MQSVRGSRHDIPLHYYITTFHVVTDLQGVANVHQVSVVPVNDFVFCLLFLSLFACACAYVGVIGLFFRGYRTLFQGLSVSFSGVIGLFSRGF